MTWLELSDFYRKTIELYRRQFGFLQVITLLMVVLSVANSVSMTTFERVGEFGTMRAMGDRSGKMFCLVVLENMIVGLNGATIGVDIGWGFASLITVVGITMPPPPNS